MINVQLSRDDSGNGAAAGRRSVRAHGAARQGGLVAVLVAGFCYLTFVFTKKLEDAAAKLALCICLLFVAPHVEKHPAVPQVCGDHRGEVPQRVRVDGAPVRAEVVQLERRAKEHAEHDDDGQQVAAVAARHVHAQREVHPQARLREADDNAREHVVRVVEAHEAEVVDVARVECEQRGDDGVARPRARGQVEAEQAHEGQEHAEQDLADGGEVVEALREHEVARVEHGAPQPRVYADDAEREVVRLHAEVLEVVRASTQQLEPRKVRPQVHEAEQHRRWLLHAEHAPERPLAVVLVHAHAEALVRRCEALLAHVVAVGRARPLQRPQHEPQVARARRLLALPHALLKLRQAVAGRRRRQAGQRRPHGAHADEQVLHLPNSRPGSSARAGPPIY